MMTTELLHIETLPEISENWLAEPQLEYVVSVATELMPKFFANKYPMYANDKKMIDIITPTGVNQFVNTFVSRYNKIQPDRSIFTRMIEDKCYPEDLQYSLDCYDINFSKFWYLCVWLKDLIDNANQIEGIDDDINLEIKKLIDVLDPYQIGLYGVDGYIGTDGDEDFKLKLNNKIISKDYRVRYVIAYALKKISVQDLDNEWKLRHEKRMNDSNKQYYLRQFIMKFISGKGLVRNATEIEDIHRRDYSNKWHRGLQVSHDKEWIAGKMEYILGVHGPEYYLKKDTTKHIRFDKTTIKEIGVNGVYKL